MSLDERLRQGLEGLDALEGAPPDEVVDAVLGRGRRSRWARRIVAGGVTLAVAIAGFVVAPKALDALTSYRENRPASPRELRREFSGTYKVEITPGDGAASAFDMTGTWTVDLLPTGAIQMTPPASFARAYGVPSGETFTVSPQGLRTNAFAGLCGSSVATYGWATDGDELSFVPVRDGCEPRRAFFTSADWMRVS
jgi:hypothetical protein